MTQNPNMQALALCELFFRDVKQKEKNTEGKYPGTDSYKKTVANNALKLLQAGLSFHELSALLAEATGTEEERNAYHIEEYLRLKRKDFVVPTVHLQQLPKNECIDIGEFYFHPFLQVTSKPARYLYNETTFEMTRIEPEPFFLEMKSSFTVKDAVQYFIKETEANELRPERHFTQMKKLIQDVGLDMTLYLIDAAVSNSFEENEKPPISPAFLLDHFETAEKMFALRKNTLKEAKLDHVIPRTNFFPTTE